MPRRRRKSRRNPFVFGRATADRESAGEMYEVYTKAEIDKLLTAMLATDIPPAPTPRSSRSSVTPRPTARQTGRQKKQEVDPDSPISFRQAKALGAALGRMTTWCPSLDQMQQAAKAQGKEGLSRHNALKAMGVTYGTASAILSELSQLPLPARNAPDRAEVEAARQEIARNMLADAGISCLIDQPAPTRSRSQSRKASTDLDSALARLANLKF